MFSKVKTLTGYMLKGRDGALGTVREFYFDDQHWAIRYLVAETGDWLTSRQVLLSPYALQTVHPQERTIDCDLSRQKIEESPTLESDQPVSRQFERSYYGYYGWPMYWCGPCMWGGYPNLMRNGVMPAKFAAAEPHDDAHGDPHLRSTKDTTGHYIQAADGEIGHVDDFIIDDETWAIRYLVVSTTNWWPGKKVLMSPQWIERVSWSESKIFVTLSRKKIRHSPEYSEELLTREYEALLHRHYQREDYQSDKMGEIKPRVAGQTD